MADTKKYFWLKLKRDFFKRHDIRIVESLDNGKDYLLFYMKLLVESIDHDGLLRFSETIPYDEKMLSTITDTNIDIVRSACKVFTELGMMEWLDDGSLFMTQVCTMIGCETSDAVRQREYREKAKQIVEPKEQERQCHNVSQKQSPELEKELEKEKKEKPLKQVFGVFSNVFLKDKEYKELLDTYGEAQTGAIIEKLSGYKEETGKKYKGDMGAIRNWVIGSVGAKKIDRPKKVLCLHCGSPIIDGLCRNGGCPQWEVVK